MAADLANNAASNTAFAEHLAERYLKIRRAEGLAAATDALLSGDRDVARTLTEREVSIDAVYREVESLVNQQLALQAPVAIELRFLLSVPSVDYRKSQPEVPAMGPAWY